MGTAGMGLPNIFLNILADPARSSAMGRQEPLAEPPAKLVLVFYTRFNLTLCEVSTEYVETQIECVRASENSDLACRASKMRRAPEYSDKGNVTALDIAWTYNILSYIPYTMASLHPSEPSILEKWLKNPPTTFAVNYSETQMWYEDIPLNIFSNRLAMVFNTYLRATFDLAYTVGSDGTSLDSRGGLWANTTGSWTTFTAPVYHVQRSWVLFFFVSAIILTLCAAANIVLHCLIHVPDFLGSISALTRDSPFISVPAPASSMDGVERSRLLRHKWVIIQDVRPDEEVGRIAFSDAASLAPLRRDRLYL
jgi:hypothetical protein